MFSKICERQTNRFRSLLAQSVLFTVVLILIAGIGTRLEAGQVEIVREYKLTSVDLLSLENRLGVEIIAGYNNVYRYRGFQYQLNYLLCDAGDVNTLLAIIRQIAPKNTYARTKSGVYEIITRESWLARHILIALNDIPLIEKGKIIPPDLPDGWFISSELYINAMSFSVSGIEGMSAPADILTEGVSEIFSQVISPGSAERIQVNYILCESRVKADDLYAAFMLRNPDPRSALRFGTLVIEISTDKREYIETVREFFTG